MVKNFLIALLCLAAQSLFAQNNTLSFYSFFGIGELKDQSTVENQMMGGLSLYADSIHLNLRNPAAYAQLKRSTYTGAFSHTQYQLKDATEQQNASLTTLAYLALGFPITKNAGIGFGITPFSAVGYNFVDESSNTQGNALTNTFTGEGGLNRVYLSAGWQPLKNLSLGATANFNFGTIEQQIRQSEENLELDNLEKLQSRINGYNFHLAAHYTPTFKDKYTLYTAVIVNTQATLVSENTKQIGSVSPVTDEEDLVEIDLENLRNTQVNIPIKTTFGLGFGENKKWLVGAQYSFQPLGEFQSEFLTQDNATFNNASTYALGGYIVPDYQARSSYFKRITYRAGLRYEVTGLEVNNEPINDFGLTFGFGLPLGNNRSNLNLGFELGQTGTTQADLVQENYLKINIGLSLNDKWFVKRRID